MSGTSIPLMGQPVNVADQYQKWAGLGLTGAQQAQTQAQTGQTEAQTGKIGQETQNLAMTNQIQAARLPFLLSAYGQGGGQPGGAPGAIGAAGGQQGDWTGPGGSVMDPNGPFSQLGALPHGISTELMITPPEKWAEAASKARQDKNAYVNQSVAATLDPATGQADPEKWNQMVQTELQQGWMTASQARQLYGHPEMAQTLLNSTMKPEDQPGTKAAQTSAEKGAAAQYETVEVNVPVLDANGQPTGQTQQQLFRKSDLLANGQPKPGAAPAQVVRPELDAAITNASNTYGVPANWMKTVASIENPSGNPNATSPTGAKGDFQFTGGTAASMGVANPTDPRQAANGAARLYLENKAQLQPAIGRAPTPGEMYVAHQQGPAGAAALINADPNARAADVFKAAGIPVRNLTVNGATPDMTAGQFLNKWESRFAGQTGAPAAPAAPAGGGAPAPGGAPQPLAAAGPAQFSPGVKASMDEEKPLIEKDNETNQANQEAAQKSIAAGVGIREARDLIQNVPTGAFIDQRMNLQSMAKQTGSPLLEKLSTAVTGLNNQQLNDAEFARKLYQANVVKEEQAVGGARIGAMFTNFFSKASPNLSLQNGALTEMTNAALIGQQMIKDYANGSNEHMTNAQQTYQQGLTSGKYQPWTPLRTYEGTWTAPDSRHAADTYAAAVHVLNGADITQAIKGLNPDQIHEAIGVISRADPGAMPKLLARPDIIEWRKSLAAQQPTQQASQ